MRSLILNSFLFITARLRRLQSAHMESIVGKPLAHAKTGDLRRAIPLVLPLNYFHWVHIEEPCVLCDDAGERKEEKRKEKSKRGSFFKKSLR